MNSLEMVEIVKLNSCEERKDKLMPKRYEELLKKQQKEIQKRHRQEQNGYCQNCLEFVFKVSRRRVIVVLTTVLGGLVLYLLYLLVFVKSPNTTFFGRNNSNNNNNKNNNPRNPLDGDSQSPTFTNYNDTIDFQPLQFSKLDPVFSLDLFEYKTRSLKYSPSNLLFQNYINENYKINNYNQNNNMRLALPTSAWYQNMLLLQTDQPTNLQRAYTIPYLIDVVGIIPGVQAHPTYMDANPKALQMSFLLSFGLTLGAAKDASTQFINRGLSKRYQVSKMTELAITLQWDHLEMYSPVVRGMPYVTMIYPQMQAQASDGRIILPTVASQLAISNRPLVDGINQLKCHEQTTAQKEYVRVERDIELFFAESDYAWLVFVSEPVYVQCILVDPITGPTILQVVDKATPKPSYDHPFVMRVALLDSCRTGRYPHYCDQRQAQADSVTNFQRANLLRKFSNMYPGSGASIAYHYNNNNNDSNNDNDDINEAVSLTFFWDAQDMTAGYVRHAQQSQQQSLDPRPTTQYQLLMFALPHHLDKLQHSKDVEQYSFYCTQTLLGNTCLVSGRIWTMSEGQEIASTVTSFRAPRPPMPKYIPSITRALVPDLQFTLPEYMQRGASDTYFSSKMLARLGRVVLIAQEVLEICGDGKSTTDNLEDPTLRGTPQQQQQPLEGYEEVCASVFSSTATSDERFTSQDVINAVNHLKSGVEIWINGTAEAPFVYDTAWGGVVNCGCVFVDGSCKNKNDAPQSCPAFYDYNLNFGNAFFNDQHFHYGYLIYAAAVVSHFDPAWARMNFERVVLFVRSIANPAKDDTAFPLYRHKDWYQGTSWASGITSPPLLNGRNQESSSEAIAAYEAVALYGSTMISAWAGDNNNDNNNNNDDKVKIAREIKRVGQLLAATEVRSARRYYHVMNVDHEDRIYPPIYQENVVGVMWNTLVEFGTWFGPEPYLPYGIQLIPLTPIAEFRDDIEWQKVIYKPFTSACNDNVDDCAKQGWSILETSILSTLGHTDIAVEKVEALSDDYYDSAGANGHSKSNMLWYIATRNVPTDIIDLEQLPDGNRGSADSNNNPTGNGNGQGQQGNNGDSNDDPTVPPPLYELQDCYRPQSCTESVLDTYAGEFKCKDRIAWLINEGGFTQYEACTKVAFVEFPLECGGCNPPGGGITNNNGNDNGDDNGNDDKDGDPIDDLPLFELRDCYQPSKCTNDVLDRDADGYSCRDRITWLINAMQESQREACTKVARVEFPAICGPCDPGFT